MQYSKCCKCIYNGYPCKMIMAQAITLLGDIARLVDYSQTRKTESKCLLHIDYECVNFKPKMEKENEK